MSIESCRFDFAGGFLELLSSSVYTFFFTTPIRTCIAKLSYPNKLYCEEPSRSRCYLNGRNDYHNWFSGAEWDQIFIFFVFYISVGELPLFHLDIHKQLTNDNTNSFLGIPLNRLSDNRDSPDRSFPGIPCFWQCV